MFASSFPHRGQTDALGHKRPTLFLLVFSHVQLSLLHGESPTHLLSRHTAGCDGDSVRLVAKVVSASKDACFDMNVTHSAQGTGSPTGKVLF